MSDKIFLKNNDKNNKDNTLDDKSKNKDNNSSFNQLSALQLLIQKHSGMKELCKQIYLHY